MKRSNHFVKNPSQRSISSFFSSTSSPKIQNVKVSPTSTSTTSVGTDALSEGCGSGSKLFCESAINKTTPTTASDLKECSPSKKRKRELSSPKIEKVPPSNIAPSANLSKKNKRLSLNSKVSPVSSKASIETCHHKTPVKIDMPNYQEAGDTPQKKSQADAAKSKKLVISPIKTEDDDVLKSILMDISPAKFDTKIPAARKKPSKLRTSSLFSLPSVETELPEKGAANESVKPTLKKSSSSSALSDTPELKYPALDIRPKLLKKKSAEDFTSSTKSTHFSSPSPLPIIISPTKPGKLTSPPVRRSPRKNSTSAALLDAEKTSKIENLSPSEELRGLGKENKEDSHVILRRSPRKHTSPCKKSPSREKGKSCSPKAHNPIQVLSDEFHDIEAVFQDDYNDVLSSMVNMKEELDLHDAHLCEVVSIIVLIPYKEVILNVKGIGNGSSASCRVSGCWLGCPVSEGDCISLQAVKVKNEWVLDNTHGFLVLHPDSLISGTTVVGSLFCARRSVLSTFFRGMDSDSPVMVIGSIVHELFQMVLQQRKSTEPEVRLLSQQLISSKKCISMLYGANMTMAQMQKELSGFIPRIVNFVAKYVEIPKSTGKDRKGAWLGAPSGNSIQTPKRGSKGAKDFSGKIIGIRDIEETLWEPKLGIKGMVDVSVEVRDLHGNKKVMPLELKTGKASFSAEHRGQVTLYTMMMSRMGQAIESGLLLYLREGEMQEVSVSHNERKDLILLRNTLAHYLKPRAPVLNVETGQFYPPRLPEPISFRSACEKCPYVTLCSVFLKQDGLSDISSDHPMVAISSSSTGHVTQPHSEYVVHWVSLLLLEDIEQMKTSNLRHIWRFTPEEREKGGQAIANLCLSKSGVQVGEKFHHTFTRNALGKNVKDLRDLGLSSGDYILISTNKQVAIDRGNIIDIDASCVKVSTNRNLFDRYAHETFHLDTSESNTVLVFNLTNLGCLLDNTESAERLRKIIIDRSVPSFSTKVEKSIIQDSLRIFKDLNSNQRNALIKTLKSDSHLLIKGLPGTGKTATMVALVQLLVRAGLSILVTSHTHSAVDNLLMRLKKAGLKFLRLGSDSRIHPQILSFSETSLTKFCKSPEDLEKVYSQQQIVGVTCLGSGHASLSKRMFDICLVDESTQVLQPSILRPLFNARRFVLVGDPEQLPPVVKCRQAQDLGLSESLFARLDSDAATVILTLNYRMNRVITDLANSLTYEGKLQCGNDKVASATLHLASPHLMPMEPWLAASLSTDIEKSAVFIDTCGAFEKQNSGIANSAEKNGESSCSNHFELSLVLKLLNTYLNNGVSTESIGVMAPYRAQVSLLTQAIKSDPNLSEIEVNTVDQFQGRDKEVIVYSCTRSDGVSHNQFKERGILNDKRRLTVAITRAKHKLVLVGHAQTLEMYDPFKKLLSCLPKHNIIPVDL